MKALSFSQPWLWAVLHAGKHVENRTWAPPIEMIDQRIALHAAKSWDKERNYGTRDGRVVTATGYLLSLKLDPPGHKESYPQSAIVGVATIDRIVTSPKSLSADQTRWFFGPFGWILKDVRVLKTPVAATGKLGLWTVPDNVESMVLEQLGRAA